MSYLAVYDALPPEDTEGRTQLVSGWIQTDPGGFFDELRRCRPILVTPAFTIVTKHHDVLSVLERSRQFSVRMYGSKMDDVVGPFMLGRDNSVENYRDKSLMRLVMPHSDLDRVRAIVRDRTSQLLPSSAGPCDIIDLVTRRVPVYLCGAYFGFPGPDVETMLRWSKATQADFFKNIGGSEEVHKAAVAAGAELKQYLRQLVEERSKQLDGCPESEPPTVVDRLIRLQIDGHLPLDPSGLVANIAGLLIGSVETTSQAVAQIIEQILARECVRKQAFRAAEDGDTATLADICWEALRFNPINSLLFRFAEEGCVIGEGQSHATMIQKGTVVFASTLSAMWDESVVDEPGDFRSGRPDYCYFHFGYFSHECLGRAIGEVMITEMVRSILLRRPTSLPGEQSVISFRGGPFPESYRLNLEGKGGAK